jgi:hypothetical protein
MIHVRAIVTLAAALLMSAAPIAMAAAAEETKVEQPPAEQPAAEISGDFPGDFDEALTLFHSGEGGKKGVGMSKLWPRVSVPALSDAQLRALLIGNTFRTPDPFAMEGDSIAFYVDPAGTVEAWYTEWDKQPDSKLCPAKEVKGDEFAIKDGSCHKLRFVDVAGTWEIKNNQLCPSLTWSDGGTQQCWYFVMLLNRVALFDPAGNMLGNEKRILKGKALDKRFVSKP